MYRFKWTCTLCLLALVACGSGDSSPRNAPPQSANQIFAGTEDTTLSGQLVASDPGDTLHFEHLGPPLHGTITQFTAAGAFTYQPNADFAGTDQFLVRVTDSVGQAVGSTVTLNIANVDDPVVARDDKLVVQSADHLDVLGNDSNVDSDALTIELLDAPFAGTATVTADNHVALQLPGGFRGFSRFTYRITDPGGSTSQATAVVFVGIPAFKVVYFGSPNATANPLLYVSNLATTHPISAPGLAVSSAGFAASGRAMTYLVSEGTPYVSTLFHVNLEREPIVHTIDPSDMAAVSEIDEYEISNDGRYVAYVRRTIANGSSEILLFDSQAGGVATRVSLDPAQQYSARGIRFSVDSSRLFFIGKAWSGPSAVFRVDLDSRIATRVSPEFGVPIVLDELGVTPDLRIVYRAVVSPTEKSVYLTNVATPDVGSLLHEPLMANEWAEQPRLSPDGAHAFIQIVGAGGISSRGVIAQLSAPGVTQRIGTPDFASVGFGDMRPDSLAMIVSACYRCNLYEVRFDDPGNPRLVNYATDESVQAARYSGPDGPIGYIRVASTGLQRNPQYFEVTHPGALGSSTRLTEDPPFALEFDFDTTGFVTAVGFLPIFGIRPPGFVVLMNTHIPRVWLPLSVRPFQPVIFQVLPD